MRSPALIHHIDASTPKRGRRCGLTATATTANPRSSTRTVRPFDYPHPIRQLVVRGLGRESPTVIITNHSTATSKFLLERYARRMTIEQRLAEAIRSFHLDSLSSSVPLNIDLDVVLSVLASAICAALRQRLPGYHNRHPRHPPTTLLTNRRRHPQNDDTITVRLDAAPTHPSYAAPTSPTQPSPGGTAAGSTSNTPRSRADLAARKSAVVGAAWTQRTVGRAG